MVQKVPELEYEFQDGYIKGILYDFPGKKRLLNRSWAAFKKKLIEEYGFEVTCVFNEHEENTFMCILMLNGAYSSAVPRAILDDRFKDSAALWLEEFRAITEKMAYDITQGMTEEEILYSCYPEKKARDEKKRRRAEKKAKKAKKKITN